MFFRYLIPLLLFFFISLAVPSYSYALDTPGLLPYNRLGTFATFNANTLLTGETGITLTLEKAIDPSFLRVSISGEHSLMENFDILFTLPFITGLENSEGFQDISLGFKHNLLKESGLKPGISYIIDASLPGRRSVSTKGRYGGGLLISKRLGPFSGSLNLFYHIPIKSSDEDEIDLRAGLNLAALHNVDALAELIIRKSHLSTKIDIVEGRMGYRVKLIKGTDVTLGLGYDFKNRTPELRLFLMVSYLLGSTTNSESGIFLSR